MVQYTRLDGRRPWLEIQGTANLPCHVSGLSFPLLLSLSVEITNSLKQELSFRCWGFLLLYQNFKNLLILAVDREIVLHYRLS